MAGKAQIGIGFDQAMRDVNAFLDESAAAVQAKLNALVSAGGTGPAATEAASALGGAIEQEIHKAEVLAHKYRDIEEAVARAERRIRQLSGLSTPTAKGDLRQRIGFPGEPGAKGLLPEQRESLRANLAEVTRARGLAGAQRELAVARERVSGLSLSTADSRQNEENQVRHQLKTALTDRVRLEEAKLADALADPSLGADIAKLEQILKGIKAQRVGIENRALLEAEYGEKTKLTSISQEVQTAQLSLQLARANVPLLEQIATQRALLAKATGAELALQTQINSAAARSLGTEVLASDLRTGRVQVLPNQVVQGEELARQTASQNQRLLRERLDAERAARRLAESQTLASDARSGSLQNVPVGRISDLEVQSINQRLAKERLEAERLAAGTAVQTTKASEAQALAAQKNAQASRFQQYYNKIHPNATAGAGGAPTLKQFVQQRGLSTIGFGLTGGLLYGGAAFAGNLLKQATELQVQFGITESVFEAFGNEINGETFEGYKRNVLSISRATGVEADEVATITRQLAGAFADINDLGTVTPNFQVGGEIGSRALKLAKITGLPEREIADAYSGTILAFTANGDSAVDVAQRLGDAVVGLEAKFGVSTTEVLQFTASLAPMASEIGFSLEQLTSFGAVVEQALGSDVAAGENIGRIFASLSQNAGPLAELLGRAGIETTGLVEAIANGDMPEALREIIGAYDQIGSNKALKAQVGELVGGARQARTFFAVLNRGEQVLNALNTESGEFDGQFDKRWEQYTKTVTYAFDRMKRTFEQLGVALFESGIVDFLGLLAQSGELVASVITDLLGLFSDFNDVLGGTPGLILAVALALKTLSAGAGLVGLTGLASFLKGISGPGRIAAGVAGGAALKGAAVLDPLAPTVAAPGAAKVLNSSAAVEGLYTQTAAPGKVRAAIDAAFLAARPLIAVAAAAAVIQTARATASDIDRARAENDNLIAQAIAAGTRPADIEANLEVMRVDSNDTGSDIANAISSGFGLLGNSKNDYASAMDKLQEIQQPRKLEQLQAILNAAGQTNDQRNLADDAMKALESNPKNDMANLIADAAIDAARKSTPELQRAISEIQNNENASADSKKAEIDALQDQIFLERSASELAIMFQAGDATLLEVVSAWKRSAIGKRRLYEIQRETQPEEAIKNLEEALKAEQAAAQLIADDYAKKESVVSAVSGGSAKALLGQKQLQFAGTTDKDQRLEIAIAIHGLQQQILEEEASLLDSASERIALLKGGFTPDASAVELIKAQVMEIDPAWIAFLETTFGSVAEAGDTIEKAAALAVKDGITFTQAFVEVIQGAVNRAKAALPNFLAGIQKVYGEGVDISGILALAGSADAATAATLKAFEDARPGLSEPSFGANPIKDSELKSLADEQKAAAEKAAAEAKAAALARITLQEAQANGDPVRLAELAGARARIEQQYAKTESERLDALAALVNAGNQADDAQAEIVVALRDLALAQTGDDPISAARDAILNANDNINRAKGQAARLNALAEKIRAERGMQQALFDLFEAQQGILIATAEATGDTVGVAELQLKGIQDKLARAASLGLGKADIANLQAQQIAAEANLRDTVLEERKATIDFQLAVGQITKQQALAGLQALLTIPDLTTQEIRDITLAIKQMKDQLGADFQYNLPTSLGLPTVYEVRRLGENPQGGSGGYIDSRTINVVVNANTNADPDQIANAVANVVGDSRRSGTYSRRF